MTYLHTGYSEVFSYNAIGNIINKSGLVYEYNPSNPTVRPHAATKMGTTIYNYDSNGNMTTRGSQALTFNPENRMATAAGETYTYDGDGVRVKKVAGGETTVYVNRYYEKNTTTNTVTKFY